MNQTPIRLIALDLDGTLIDPGNNGVHPDVRGAIRRALAQGVVVTLATGRPFAFTRPVALELGLRAPLLCYQGGVIREMDGRVLRQITFAPGVLAPALALARRRQWQFYFEGDGAVYREANLPYDPILAQILALPIHTVADLGAADQVPPPNQFGVYLPAGVTEADVAAVQAAVGPAATVLRTHHAFFNGFPSEVSKGASLGWLAARLGIPRVAVMAVGDADNDASMVAWAGLGVAMGNARPSVLAVADWVAPPLEAQGVAAALERFVLSGA